MLRRCRLGESENSSHQSPLGQQIVVELQQRSKSALSVALSKPTPDLVSRTRRVVALSRRGVKPMSRSCEQSLYRGELRIAAALRSGNTALIDASALC
jgi:hypothetical protein